jgi:hypothetical protein
MKKNLLQGLLFSLLLLGNQVMAQNGDSTKTAKTYLDPVLNLVSTNLNYGTGNSILSDYQKPVLGAQIGVAFQAGITSSFSLVSECYFSMKGGKLTAGNPLTTQASAIRLYSFELPILARFHFSEFHINAGPSIAYNFYGTGLKDYEHLDAGLQAGGGYTFHTKRKRIMLDMRYNYGLTNISNRQEIYNRSFVVSIHVSKAWKTNPFAKQ